MQWDSNTCANDMAILHSYTYMYLLAVHVDHGVTNCQICYDDIVEFFLHNTGAEDVSLIHGFIRSTQYL